MDNLSNQSIAPVEPPKKANFKIIAGVLMVIIVAIGGFFIFSKYKPTLLSTGANFFSPEFDKYAIGADASSFVFIRNDDNLKNFINKFELPIKDQLNDFKSALVVSKMNNQKESLQATLQFGSAKSADEVKNFLLSQLSQQLKGIEIISKEAFILISKKDGDDFKGSFYDNPHFKEVSDYMTNNQFIIYTDVGSNPSAELSRPLFQLLPQTAYVPQGLLPVASAAILSASDVPGAIDFREPSVVEKISPLMSLAKNNIFTIKVSDTDMIIKFISALTTKEEFIATNSPVYKLTDSEKEKYYNSAIQASEKVIPDFEKTLNGSPLITKIPSAKFNFSFIKNIFNLQFKISLSDLQKSIMDSLSSGPKKAHDTIRKSNLQNIQKALIVYNLDGNNYPSASQCVEKITEISKSFPKGMPVDPSGSQKYDLHGLGLFEATCSTGYYYQVLPNLGYILWARMEDSSDGNFNKSQDKITSENDVILGKGGEFYIIFSKESTIGGSSSLAEPSSSGRIKR